MVKTGDKAGLVPGDGKVIVAFNPEVRVFPCEVEAWYAKNDKHRLRAAYPSGYFQGKPGAEGPPLPHFHGEVR